MKTSNFVITSEASTSFSIIPDWIRSHSIALLCVFLFCTGFFSPTVISVSGGTNISATNTGGAVTVAITGQVAVANGGTGVATLTAHGIVVGNGASPVNVTGAGTSGQVMTSNGAAADPTFQSPVTATTASASLTGATYTLTTNNYEDVTGLSVSLSAGTWRCSGNIVSLVTCSAGAGSGFIVLELYDSTATAEIANSERLGGFCSQNNVASTVTTPIDEIFTLSTTSTVIIRAKSPAGATYAARQITSDTSGRSRLVCGKIAP